MNVTRHNSRKGSKRNIIAHYDLGNTLYKSFLDQTMMYSAAIYPKESSSLEEASFHKLETICSSMVALLQRLVHNPLMRITLWAAAYLPLCWLALIRIEKIVSRH